MLLNRFSFLMFGTVPPLPSHLLGLPVGGNSGPSAASLIVVPGETYTVYLPIDEVIALDTDRVDLMTDTASVPGPMALSGVGTLTQVDVDVSGARHFTLTFTVPAGSLLASGYYRLRLNTTTGGRLSNRVWLRRSGYESDTALFSFRNARPVGPIAYDLPGLAQFRNALRLKCYLSETATETDLETYEAETTGVKRVVGSKTHHAIKIVCPNTDNFGHEGWRTLLAHKDLMINNRRYALKSGYTEAEPVGYLATGSFEVWEQSYSVINRC